MVDPATAAPGTKEPTTQAEAAEAPAKRASTTLPRTPFESTVQGRLDTIDQRLTRLEDQRERLLEFSFQSILVVLTILGLAAGIPFALLYGMKIAVGDVAYLIAALLFALVVLMIQWLRLWWRVNVPRTTAATPTGGNGSKTTSIPVPPVPTAAAPRSATEERGTGGTADSAPEAEDETRPDGP